MALVETPQLQIAFVPAQFSEKKLNCKMIFTTKSAKRYEWLQQSRFVVRLMSCATVQLTRRLAFTFVTSQQILKFELHHCRTYQEYLDYKLCIYLLLPIFTSCIAISLCFAFHFTSQWSNLAHNFHLTIITPS